MAVHADPSRAAAPSALPGPTVPAPAGAPSRGRRPALDGVRGIAIALVLMHHFTEGFEHRPEGGFLGVDLFFVLSGYLITGVLVRGRGRTGRIGLSGFWLRRARRLLPPLLLVLVLVTWLVHTVGPAQEWPYQRDDALSALFYTANLHTIASLDAWGGLQHANLLLHTWSLAVEEQFYLVWPLLLAGLLAIGSRVGRLAGPALWACVVLGAGSFAWLAAGYLTGTGPWAYFDTRGRVGELLAGAALALALPRVSRSATNRLGDRAGRLWGTLAAVGLLGVLAAVGTLDQMRPAYYLGGALAVTLAAVALVAAVEASPGGVVARSLGAAPLVALGWISYTLYLVHFPVMTLITLPHPLTLGGVLMVEGVRLTFSLGFATLSYLLLERPLLAGTLPWVGSSRPRLALAGMVTTLASAVAVIAWTSLPGDFDSQVRADPVVACPGQTQRLLTTCTLSPGTQSDGTQPDGTQPDGANGWVVTGTGTRPASPGRSPRCPGSGSPRRRGLPAAPAASWPRSSGKARRPSPSPPPSSAHGTPLGWWRRRSRSPGPVCCSWPTGPRPSSRWPPAGCACCPAPAPTTMQSVPRCCDSSTRPPTGASARCCCGSPRRPRIWPPWSHPAPPAARIPPDADEGEMAPPLDDVLTAVAAARPAWARVVSLDDLVCPGGSCPAVIDGLLVRHGTQTFAPGFARRLAGRAGGAGAGALARLDDDRDDHRPAPVALVDPAPDHAPHDLLQLVGVADAAGRRLGQRVGDPRLDRVEHGVVLGEAAGVDLRAGDDLAGAGVDDHDDGDEALLAEDAPVLEVGVGDLADARAVDVDVAAPHGADDPRDAVDEVDDDAVLGDHDALARHAGLDRELGVGARGAAPRRAPA